MTTKKKHLWFLVLTILAVVVVGTSTVTYAWFLSLYSAEYQFQLDSEDQNRVILTYETALAFASGNASDSGNALVPATAKKSNNGLTLGTKVGPNETVVPIEPLDVFDADTDEPEHTGLMSSSARAVRFTATGAYWVGYSDRAGALSFSLTAYAKEGGVLSSYDLVAGKEIAYFVIFHYMGEHFLYYDGQYYMNDTQNDTFTLPNIVDTTLRYWRALTSSDTIAYRNITDFAFTTDGTQLLLLPNSRFEYDLYVFVAKPDELLSDPDLNGKTLQLSATIAVPALAEPAQNP